MKIFCTIRCIYENIIGSIFLYYFMLPFIAAMWDLNEQEAENGDSNR